MATGTLSAGGQRADDFTAGTEMESPSTAKKPAIKVGDRFDLVFHPDPAQRETHMLGDDLFSLEYTWAKDFDCISVNGRSVTIVRQGEALTLRSGRCTLSVQLGSVKQNRVKMAHKVTCLVTRVNS